MGKGIASWVCSSTKKRQPTTLAAAGGYTCKNNTAPRSSAYRAFEHLFRSTKLIKTRWLPIPCGHITSHLDAGCAGCKHRQKAE